MGVPVVSTMEVATLGNIDRHPVYVNKPILDLDWIVPVNRIKAHTDYHGPHESGLVKMLVIGMEEGLKLKRCISLASAGYGI